MRPVTEKHSGSCGHCKTSVPIDATVCTGCGAVWGLSNNLSREETYDAHIKSYKRNKTISITLLIIGLLLYFTGEYGLMAVSIFFSVMTFFSFSLHGSFIKRAKKGKVSWYRMLNQN